MYHGRADGCRPRPPAARIPIGLAAKRFRSERVTIEDDVLHVRPFKGKRRPITEWSNWVAFSGSGVGFRLGLGRPASVSGSGVRIKQQRTSSDPHR